METTLERARAGNALRGVSEEALEEYFVTVRVRVSHLLPPQPPPRPLGRRRSRRPTPAVARPPPLLPPSPTTAAPSPPPRSRSPSRPPLLVPPHRLPPRPPYRPPLLLRRLSPPLFPLHRRDGSAMLRIKPATATHYRPRPPFDVAPVAIWVSVTGYTHRTPSRSRQ